jgi:hypothetical protein
LPENKWKVNLVKEITQVTFDNLRSTKLFTGRNRRNARISLQLLMVDSPSRIPFFPWVFLGCPFP